MLFIIKASEFLSSKLVHFIIKASEFYRQIQCALYSKPVNWIAKASAFFFKSVHFIIKASAFNNQSKCILTSGPVHFIFEINTCIVNASEIYCQSKFSLSWKPMNYTNRSSAFYCDIINESAFCSQSQHILLS